ncbi:MAG: right-handed parallel beta-helix repeat-containing protein, partial [Candidatus Kariarchaeaceae archaeon]
MVLARSTVMIMFIGLNFLTIIGPQLILLNYDLKLNESQEVLNNTLKPEIIAQSFRTMPKIASKQDHEQDPIHINGNTNFTATATLRGWPGDGSKFNPYIIEGLNFTGLTSSTQGVDEGIIIIKNTDVYFQINSCFLDINAFSNGILLKNVNHGQISKNSINNMMLDETFFWPSPGIAIHLEESRNIAIFGNSIWNSTGQGIYLDKSLNNSIIENNISDNAIGGIFFKDSLD